MSRAWLLAVAASVVSPVPAAAVHYNRGAFVPAFQACDAAVANTRTTRGIPACTPPVRVSDCAKDPVGALRLRPDAKSGFLYRNTGRRETRANHGDVDIQARIVVTGVETCTGAPYSGSLDAEILLRMYREDRACDTGRCVLPDFAYRHRLACESGRCELRRGSADQALLALGLPELPSDMFYSIRYLRFAVLDRAGRVLFANGLQSSRQSIVTLARAAETKSWLERLRGSTRLAAVLGWLAPRIANAYVQTTPNIAKRLLTRYVQAHAPCSRETANTATREGLPACTAVTLSDCRADPDNAIVAVVPVEHRTMDGRGKFLYELRGDRLQIKGHLAGIENCAAQPYEGVLTLRMTVRSTLDDPACGAAGCTATDTSMLDLPLVLAEGEVALDETLALDMVGPFPGGAKVVDYEIVGTEILDRSGNVALEGPSTLVRCNPIDAATGGFCYGN
jgi:hypothetical protein